VERKFCANRTATHRYGSSLLMDARLAESVRCTGALARNGARKNRQPWPRKSPITAVGYTHKSNSPREGHTADQKDQRSQCTSTLTCKCRNYATLVAKETLHSLTRTHLRHGF